MTDRFPQKPSERLFISRLRHQHRRHAHEPIDEEVMHHIVQLASSQRRDLEQFLMGQLLHQGNPDRIPLSKITQFLERGDCRLLSLWTPTRAIVVHPHRPKTPSKRAPRIDWETPIRLMIQSSSRPGRCPADNPPERASIPRSPPLSIGSPRRCVWLYEEYLATRHGRSQRRAVNTWISQYGLRSDAALPRDASHPLENSHHRSRQGRLGAICRSRFGRAEPSHRQPHPRCKPTARRSPADRGLRASRTRATVPVP